MRHQHIENAWKPARKCRKSQLFNLQLESGFFFFWQAREKRVKKKQRIKKVSNSESSKKRRRKSGKINSHSFFSAGRRREIFPLILLNVCKSAVDSHDSEIKQAVDWINHWMQRQSWVLECCKNKSDREIHKKKRKRVKCVKYNQRPRKPTRERMRITSKKCHLLFTFLVSQ